MERPHRVAVGSILTECNQFGGKLIERAEFARSQLARGEAVMSIGGGAVGGMLHTLKEQNAGIVPLVVASSYPGGPIDHECYAQTQGGLTGRSQQCPARGRRSAGAARGGGFYGSR